MGNDSSAKLTVKCPSCGHEFVAYRSNHRRYCSKSCYHSAMGKRRRTHGMSGTRLYRIWCDMKSRCNNKKHVAFNYYGGRGVSVCVEWASRFECFHAWAMQSGYLDELELDRVDCDGDYEPSNCRWATREQQMANQRKRADAKTSKYKGVSIIRKTGRWRAQTAHGGVPVHIGCYATEEEAAAAYDKYMIEHHGEFANPNFKEE